VITIADTLTIKRGAILQTTNAGNHRNSIVGGMLTSGLLNTDGTSADLIIHNWNPKTPLVIASSIVNNAALNRIVNLVHVRVMAPPCFPASTATPATHMSKAGCCGWIRPMPSLPTATSASTVVCWGLMPVISPVDVGTDATKWTGPAAVGLPPTRPIAR
jgi:hypothetical protein